MTKIIYKVRIVNKDFSDYVVAEGHNKTEIISDAFYKVAQKRCDPKFMPRYGQRRYRVTNIKDAYRAGQCESYLSWDHFALDEAISDCVGTTTFAPRFFDESSFGHCVVIL